ncbi:hypothetical protein BVRB_5g108560 [Beta vulgaris subsp. vulgaris]|nr:hypothetical protein BVRB_5g108560 [Beta vulgaris subsp. vulgaris]
MWYFRNCKVHYVISGVNVTRFPTLLAIANFPNFYHVNG